SADSRSAISGTRLSVNSEAGPGAAGSPTTRTGCCDVPGKPAAEVSTVPSSTTPLTMTVARRRRMIKDYYVPRRNQPGRLLGEAQRSQLPPAVHLAAGRQPH